MSAMIINLVTIVVMCVAVFYAARLNRALTRARDGRSELAQLITSLTEAHGKAEAAIKTMKATAGEYEADLQKVIVISRGLADELLMINESSNALANRMERLAPLARGSFEAAYRAGEEEQSRPATAQPAAVKDKNTLRAAERPVTSSDTMRARPAEAPAKKVDAPTLPLAAPANVRSMAQTAESADGAPRSRAEQELFAAIETLRKGRS